MSEWFNSLSGLGQALFIIGCAGTGLFIIQLILLLIGLGDSGAEFAGGPDVDIADDIDADGFNDGGLVDIGGLRIVTLRGIIAFFSIGSWSALLVLEATDITALAIVIGIISGIIAAILLAYVMKKSLLLQDEGNIIISNALGKIGNVYIKIPKQKTGVGKVNVVIQEKLTEFDAITDEDEELLTGSQIVVVGVLENILIVKKFK